MPTRRRLPVLPLVMVAIAAGADASATSPIGNALNRRAALTQITLPAIDDCDDRVGHCLFGRPGQLCVIDGQECVAAQGGRRFFDCNLRVNETQASSPAFLPLLTQEEAWQTLPALEHGTKDRLPLWALATAKALPGTTAAVLELEYRHRALSPLDAVLRGQIRLVAAHANRCGYTQAQAEADLRRGGAPDADIKKLLEKGDNLPPVLRCARKLTVAAYTVTDAEVAELVKSIGEKQLVAVVQLVAFANFQDRLVLALGISREPDGPLPPRDWRFAKESKAMERPAWPTAPAKAAPMKLDAEWRSFSFSDLKKNMEVQKERPLRIRVPTWDEVKVSLPPESQKRELRIKWSLVCMGYQPELAQGWSACTKAFRDEAAMDRVFEESLFWVVTRTLQCFY